MPTPTPTFASPDVVRTFARELDTFARELAVQPPALRFYALRLFVVVLLRGLEDENERAAVRAMYRDAARRARENARRSLARWGALECDTCGWPLEVDDAARGVCRPCRRRLRAITGTDPLQETLAFEPRGDDTPCAFCSHLPGGCPASCNCECIVRGAEVAP